MRYSFFHSLAAKPASLPTIAIWCLLSMIACSEDRFLTEIDIDLENPEVELVLESTIRHSDTLISVYFSRSQSVLEPVTSSLISSATVEIFLNDISLGAVEEITVNSLRDNQPGSIYQLRIDSAEVKAGDMLRIEATSPEGERVIAVEQMPSAANLFSASYLEGRQSSVFYGSNNSVRAIIDDPGDEENFYVFFGEERSRALNGSPAIGFDTVMFKSEVILEPGDAFTDGDFLGFTIAKDLTFNGTQGAIILGTSWEPRMGAFEDSQLFVILGSVNRSAYNYDVSLDALFRARDNPFAEPVVLPNTLSGGRGVLRLINDASELRAIPE